MSDENTNEVTPQEMVLALEAGDTYEMIAEAFETSVESIKELNPEVDISQETPGENIRIPGIPRCEGGTLYVVKAGDTLYGLAQRFGVTVAAIRQANPFLEFLGLRVGLTICIPGNQPVTCQGGFFYTVMAGDTLFSIAARFNTTVEEILRANPGLDPNRLLVGQRICIPVAPPTTCPGGFFYTVMAGDTLFSIAARFNTTVEAILRANPGLDPNRLFVGQRICIPVAPPTTCPGGFFYTVMAGDTLFSIAARFNTTVEAILRANPGLDPNRLFIGQQICIPVAPPVNCPGGFFYTVAPGDTLFNIAARFNTSVDSILRANPGLDPNRLFVGQRICIPVAPPVTCQGGFFYTVAPGDTLFSIAARFNTTVESILRANPGLDPNRLFIGQRICIPVAPPVTCPGGFFYTVVAGDTLFSIAARFNTTVEAILRANPGLDPNRLFVGQQICIPVTPPVTCQGGFFYTVMAGDTLFSIANRYNTTVSAILQANPGLDPNRLFVGQRICIPA